MATTSLRFINSRLDLIYPCERLLKSIWPHCRADRLRQLAVEESTGGTPCSLILVRHVQNVPDKIIAHVRLVPITKPDTPKSVYLESLCVEKSWQGMGYGKTSMYLAERYAMTLGIRQVYIRCIEALGGYYKGLSYKENPGLLSYDTVGANLLRSYDTAYSWYGNRPKPGWETAYDGVFASNEAIRELGLITLVKDLRPYVKSERRIQQPISKN